jgi:hypothetical protein
LSYEAAAEKLRTIYDEIESSWNDFLVRCDEAWSLDQRPEVQSVCSAQRLRHASDEKVAERSAKLAERNAAPAPKHVSAPKKQSAVQIMNHSLALTKDKTKCLRGPWYAQHWHLFAPFLPEDLRSRSGRLAVQLAGEMSMGEGSSRSAAFGEARGDDYSKQADLAAKKAAAIRQPRTIVNGTMFPYQLEGLQWMVRQHSFGVGGILGDEMGLGKTLQVALQIIISLHLGISKIEKVFVWLGHFLPSTLEGDGRLWSVHNCRSPFCASNMARRVAEVVSLLESHSVPREQRFEGTAMARPSAALEHRD